MSERPSNSNMHHTLYYRRDYERRPLTRAWRRHPMMIVPMDITVHNQLHREVPPVGTLPSDFLARYALNFCALNQARTSSRTRGFASVRDELYGLYKKSPRSLVGREALRFSEQFTAQLDYIKKVPLLESYRDLLDS